MKRIRGIVRGFHPPTDENVLWLKGDSLFYKDLEEWKPLSFYEGISHILAEINNNLMPVILLAKELAIESREIFNDLNNKADKIDSAIDRTQEFIDNIDSLVELVNDATNKADDAYNKADEANILLNSTIELVESTLSSLSSFLTEVLNNEKLRKADEVNRNLHYSTQLVDMLNATDRANSAANMADSATLDALDKANLAEGNALLALNATNEVLSLMDSIRELNLTIELLELQREDSFNNIANQLQLDVNTAITNAVTQTNLAVQLANEATTNANTAASNANTTNTNVLQAETLRVTEFNEMMSLANTATLNANDAADNANTAAENITLYTDLILENTDNIEELLGIVDTISDTSSVTSELLQLHIDDMLRREASLIKVFHPDKTIAKYRKGKVINGVTLLNDEIVAVDYTSFGNNDSGNPDILEVLYLKPGKTSFGVFLCRCGNCINARCLEDYDMSNVTSMERMFAYDGSMIHNPDFSRWNLAKLINVEFAFCGLSGKAKFPTEWPKLTSMYAAFAKWGPNEVDLRNMNAPLLTTMSSMCMWSLNMEKFDMSGSNLPVLTSMYNMFGKESWHEGSHVKYVNISNCSMPLLQSMENMFIETNYIEEIDFTGTDLSSVTNMRQSFKYCGRYATKPTVLKLDNTNFQNLIYMDGAFYGCKSLLELDLSPWNVTNVTSAAYMFQDAVIGNLTGIGDFLKITDMHLMFLSATIGNNILLLIHNESEKPVSIQNMFCLANIPEVAITNSVIYSENCVSLFLGFRGNKIDLSNTTLIIEGSSSFAFFGSSASEIITTDANIVFKGSNYRMFYANKVLEYLDCSRMDFSENSSSMLEMFFLCSKLKKIGGFIDLGTATSIVNMFSECRSLRYVTIKNLGKSCSNTLGMVNCPWGTLSEENRLSMVDSLVTYSYDRAANGMSAMTIQLRGESMALLTDAEKAAITAKGFTLT